MNSERRDGSDVSIFGKKLFWVMTYFDCFFDKLFMLFGDVTLDVYLYTLLSSTFNSLIRYFSLKSCYITGTVLGTGDTSLRRKAGSLCSLSLHSQ